MFVNLTILAIVLVLFVSTSSSVPLDPEQYDAVMAIYAANPSCDTNTICVPFGSSDECPNRMSIACDNGNVTKL